MTLARGSDLCFCFSVSNLAGSSIRVLFNISQNFDHLAFPYDLAVCTGYYIIGTWKDFESSSAHRVRV